MITSPLTTRLQVLTQCCLLWLMWVPSVVYCHLGCVLWPASSTPWRCRCPSGSYLLPHSTDVSWSSNPTNTSEPRCLLLVGRVFEWFCLGCILFYSGSFNIYCVANLMQVWYYNFFSKNSGCLSLKVKRHYQIWSWFEPSFSEAGAQPLALAIAAHPPGICRYKIFSLVCRGSGDDRHLLLTPETYTYAMPKITKIYEAFDIYFQ